MRNTALLKALQQFYTAKVAAKRDAPFLSGRSPAQPASGFTLLEVLVVAIMIGILSAIAVPSWVAFVNQQRVNAANDAVLKALQEAQREAKRRKLSYSVSFKTDATNKPQIALYTGLIDNASWKFLGADLQLQPGQIWVGTNISNNNNDQNQAVNSVSVPPSSPSSIKPTITFNSTGTLPLGSDTGLKVVVALTQSANSTQPVDSTKRCIIVKTLLGTMRIAKGTACN